MPVQKFIVACSLMLLGACSTLNVSDDPTNQVSNDPLNGFNRAVYSFNNTSDRIVLKPVANAYTNVVPKPARKGVSNFFRNLGEPLNVLNNLLQGKVDRALDSTYRFAVNSTIGIFGLFDVAKAYDVDVANEDLGQTLAAWGVKPGPYLMLPFLGPSNFRDGLGLATSSAIYYPIGEITDSNGTRLGLTALGIIDTRAGLLGTDDVLDKQLDPYAFLKVAFEQNRLNQIYDGNPPENPDDDLDF